MSEYKSHKVGADPKDFVSYLRGLAIIEAQKDEPSMPKMQAYWQAADHIAELEQRIAEMEGDGYVTAAECLDNWWNQSNVQGVATMTREELLDICAEFQSYGKEAQPAPTDEHCAWTVEDPRQQEGSGNE